MTPDGGLAVSAGTTLVRPALPAAPRAGRRRCAPGGSSFPCGTGVYVHTSPSLLTLTPCPSPQWKYKRVGPTQFAKEFEYKDRPSAPWCAPLLYLYAACGGA